MSEPIDSPSEESARNEADYLSFKPGQRLKKARELRGLTLAQAATELRLSQRYVQAMEADAYKDLPEPIFVRGYMRRYAQLVKISPDDIAAKFDQCYAADTETPEPDVRPRNPIQILGDIARPRLRLRKLLSWASLALIVALLLGFLFWNGIGSHRASVPVVLEPEAAVIEPVVVAPDSPSVTTLTDTAPAAASGINSLPAPSGPAVLPAPVGVSATPTLAPATQPATPTAIAGPDTLLIALSADSWVSVHDAKQLLVSELKHGGQTLTLKGEAPFSVNLGNAPAATLSLNGRPVDLKPYTQGAAASLTVKR